VTALWTLLLLVGVLWPGRVLSSLDGIPLSGRVEAIVIGVALPALWWLDRGFLARRWVRVVILVLASVKLAAWFALPQHGLCARFSTSAPFSGASNSIPISEPTGSLRSWDVRADLYDAAPRCTAILDRSYRSASEFPVWFLNLFDVIRPGRSDLALDVTGYVTVDAAGSFVMEIGPDMIVSGRVGHARILPDAGHRDSIEVPLAAGSHPVELHISLSGERWRFAPLWNGRDAWASTRLTASAPSRLDGLVSRPLAFATTAIVLLLVSAWTVSALGSLDLSVAVAAWTVAAACLLVWIGAQGRFERLAGPLLLGSVFVPVATGQRNIRSAFVLLGIPWLGLFVGHSLSQIGRVTAYTFDDWHLYQSAAYRIFMNGYWLEGGSLTFYHQALYRWVAGTLHLLFGDSSVGEVYWDAACLLLAALVCFAIVKRVAGFRWAVAAAAIALATFTVGTIWYVVGRGLSEITAVGWMSMAAFFLMRARLGRASAALTAGIFGVLMFYSRLNHLLFAGSLIALLLPTRAHARWSDGWRAVRRVHVRSAGIYAVTLTTGVLLFAARTWWYTGRFSILYGTSFGVQENGLRLSTIGSPVVWAAVGKSLGALLWMHEPPSPDVRATFVVLGVLLSVLALIQIPYANRLPLSIALVTTGAIAGGFVAHSHEYPGRMSVHLVPFTVAMSVTAASQVYRALLGQPFHRDSRPASTAGVTS
jgi:hypothetical protein